MATRPHEDWQERWRELSRSALESVSAAKTLDELERLRVGLLGRKGRLTFLLKGLKDLPLEERRRLGPEANALKTSVQRALETRRGDLDRSRTEAELEKTRVDLTLPATPLPSGRRHPITQTIDRMAGILAKLGFTRADGPLVETERYNFEALNIPADHPARDMQDTLYLANGGGGAEGLETTLLMRTHTSPVQIRYMEKHPPPVHIMAPGRVFRHEAVDASHSAVFHQVEGLYVAKSVTMADLKGTLQTFLRELLGSGTKTRFRPSYFPFTEPSAEVDVHCLLCGGSGCPACQQAGWLEMLGAGLVHPNVLRGVGCDPEVWSGFAFGIGVERIAMLLFGIPDIRMFYENDLRFLEQFQ
ncbi:MAG: phenylalanine--tRNA ligase subunit alpha [Elusimicrobiota bacterium]